MSDNEIRQMGQQLLADLMDLDSGPQFRARQRSTAERAKELNAIYSKLGRDLKDLAERRLKDDSR